MFWFVCLFTRQQKLPTMYLNTVLDLPGTWFPFSKEMLLVSEDGDFVQIASAAHFVK